MDWFRTHPTSLMMYMYTFTTVVCSTRILSLPLIVNSYFLIYFMMGNVHNANTISSLQMDLLQQHLPNDDINGEQYPSSTLVRLNELELFRCYLILSMERLNLEGIDGVFMSLRQSHRSHIYTAVPLFVFDA